MILITPLLLIIFGILIKYGKMYNLLTGYNTMTDEEKAKINIKKLSTLFRNVMFGMAFIIITGYLISTWFSNPKIEIASLFGAFLIGIPYLLIKANSDSYKIKKKDTK